MNDNKKYFSIFSSEIEIHHHSSEDSDGISVISESELCKTMSENETETEKGEETVTDDEKFEAAEFQLPITPPPTPKIGTDNNNDDNDFELCFLNNNSMNFLFGAGLIVIVAVFYSHINNLRSDIQSCDQRILKLEEENKMLKAALAQLEMIANPTDALIDIDSINMNQDSFDFLDNEEPREPPLTKAVWLGSDITHKVEILDKKYELPDYCYQTQGDDLFYEYNQEVCEQKRRKLEKTKRKKLQRQAAVDESREWNEKNYDEYIQDTLKTLNDEIIEIKRKRSSDVTEEFSPNQSPPEKPTKSKRKKQKRKDKNWIEERVNGREEARKVQQEEKDNLNWYLKRKNERELDRVEA